MKLRAFITTIIAILLTSLAAVAQNSCNLSLVATPVGASCSNACDASVILNPTGGTAPYSFNAFEHTFPGSSVDQTVFDVRNGNFSVSGNVLTALPSLTLTTDYDNSITTKTAFPDNGKIVVEGSFYIDYNTYGNFGLAENDVIVDQYQLPYSFFFSYGTLYVMNEGNLTEIGSYSNSTWYDFKIEKLGSTVNFYMRNVGVATYTKVATTTATLTHTSYKFCALYNVYQNFYGGFKTANWRVGGNPPTTGLCPGTYSYTVFDAAGCFATATVTLGVSTGPGGLTLNGSATAASCATAADATATLNPTGGTGPYSYGLGHQFLGSNINTNIFELRNGNFSQGTDLREGTSYAITNTWDNSVSTRRTFSDGGYLLFEGSFKFDANSDVVFGFTNTGTIDDFNDVLIGFRVTGTQLYALSTGGSLTLLPSILVNTWYDFKIEKTGNTIRYYTRLSNASSYTLRNTRSYSSSRVEYKVGSLNFANFFSSSGGYNTKNWNIQSTPKTSELSPGTYTYTISDANGCTATKVLNVIADIANVVSLSGSLVNGACGTASNGAVALTPAAGKAPYSYAFTQNFTGSTINNGLFEIRNGLFVQDGSSLRGEVITVNTQWDNSIATYYTFTDAAQMTFEGTSKFDANSNVYIGFLSNIAVINDPSAVQIGYFVNGTQLFVRAGSTNISAGTININTWYDFKIEKQENVVRFYIRQNGSSNYTLLTTVPYSGTQTTFRFGALMFGATGTYGGFNTKNWVINDNPPTTGLKAGTYTYKVYDAPGCNASVSIVVPVNNNFQVNTTPSNTTAWNTCDGSIAITSNDASVTYLSKVYNKSFAGSSFNASEFTVRNGSFSQNNALVAANVANNSGWDNSIATSQAYNDNGKIVAEMEMQFSAGTDVYFGLARSNQALNANGAMGYAFRYTAGVLYAYVSGSGPSETFVGNVAAGQWNSYKVEKIGTTVNFYIRPVQDNQYQLLYSTTVSPNGTSYKLGILNFYDNSSSNRSYSSRNWSVYNSAVTTGLCIGSYTYLATTTSGCSAEVTFNVGTNLALAQTMTAPANVSVNTNLNSNVATGVALGTPTFAATPTGITVTNDAPAQFPLGVTTVTWRAVDANGLVVTKTQTVTVIDAQAPVLNVPANVTAEIYLGQTSRPVNTGTATGSDNASGVTITNNAPAEFPVGTTVVTWTARDAAGNVTTATQLVTVVMVNLPAVTPPDDVTVGTDAGKAYATGVALGTPSLAVPVVGINITNNAPAQFPLGTTTVTWTVSMLSLSTTATQLVTVVDNEPPVLNAPANITVNNTPGQPYANLTSLGTATGTDNASSVTITNDNTLTQFPIGSTTVTWTATDAAGNTTTKKQIITVVDNQPPSLVIPANVTVSTDDGVAYATNVDLGKATATDNSDINVTITNNAPAQYPVGNTIVTWTAIDDAGNKTTATQTVTVVDTENPTITAPAAVNLTVQLGSSGVNGPISLGTPVFKDNVPGSTVSNDAPAFYPVGITTITWTVRDAAGNTATATQTVTVIEASCPAATASIASASDACGIRLTASGGASYQWKFGNNLVATSPQIILGSNSAAGVYTVIATNSCGNSASATYTFAGGVTSQSSGTAYTIVGLKTVRLGESNEVRNGGIGVTASNGEAAIKKNSIVDGAIRARYIYTQNPVTAGSKTFSAATVTLPAMQYYSGSTYYYSNYTVNNNVTVTLNNNYRDLYIKAGANVTVAGNTFKTITIEEGATVSFTATTLNIESLLVGKGLSGIATAKFANNTSVRVTTQVKVEGGSIINPDGNKVSFFLGDSYCDEEKFIVKGNGSKITADVYIPNGSIMVQSSCGHGYGCSSDSYNSWIDYLYNVYYGASYPNSTSSSCATTYMTGTFIGENVESGNKVVWKGNAATCNTVAVTDNVAPVINCVAPQTFCKSANGSYTVPSVSGTDNSGVVNFTYTMSGATTRSGSGNNASGTFGVGTTTITWTATDANGNRSTCATTVKVNDVASASISSSTADVFCGDVTLKATSTTSGVTYKWTYNNAIVGAGQTFTVGSGSAEGNYVLTVTDANGCTNTAADTYTHSRQNLLGSYAIVGINKVSLNESNNVQTGGVGVISANGVADFKNNSSVAGSGGFVKAKSITVQSTSVNIPNKVYAPAVIGLPVMQVFSGSYGCNDYTVAQNATVSLTGNYRSLTIKKGATVTLSGTTFRKIKIEEGAKVTFTSTTLNIEDITVGKGPNTGFTRVSFANNTSVRVSKQVKIEDNCLVNPEGRKVIFYVGDTQCDEEKFYVGGSRTTVNANVYAPTGVIRVTGGTVTQSYMNGVFIAGEVKSEAKGVIWNGYNCSNNARTVIAEIAAPVVKKPVEAFEVSAAPNPSTNFFTIKVNTKSTEMMNIKVADISGRLVEVITNQDPGTILKIGAKWTNGAYLVEITQGNERQTLRLIKAN